MNKDLFVKVKKLCKDTGLSEKYLKAITEKMGGSIEDDSTDEAAIDEMANQIADIAKETQGEATRWAGKKEPKDPKEPTDPKEGNPKEPKDAANDSEARIKALEDEIAGLKGNKEKEDRAAAIKDAQAKHGIPDWRMKGLVVPEDQEPDKYLAEIKQDLINQKLMSADTEGVKVASETATNEYADSLLESITVK